MEAIMFKKLIACFTLVCFVITLSGCVGHSTEEITRDALPAHETQISEVVTTTGEVYTFKESMQGNYATLKDTFIVGFLEDGQKIEIPMSQVTRISVMRVDAGKTFLFTMGGIAIAAVIVVAIIAATKQSCPFVYSYDGARYVFDGEPYGGAICEGLKRTDWSRLEHLRPVDGEYRLLLTNEVNETQFTDELKLWVFDHSPDQEILLDASGKAYTVAQRIKPAQAWDNHGKDQMLWLSENDKLVWESDMSARNPKNPGDLRDSIWLTFPKQKDALNAKLIVSGSTTLWGSQMLKRMTQLRGEAIPRWYEEMKSPQAQQMLDLWNLREELYHLQVRVKVGNAWVTRNEILGGGPFVTEERVVPLDLQGVEGETVEILLTPPAGFWQLNSFAMDYSTSAPVEVQELNATTITGDENEDLLDVLSATDGRYYAAPRNGQTAYVVFPIPAAKPNSQRTIFAKASGYYEMHMDIAGTPETEILNRIMLEPGYPASFAIEEYLKWKSELMQARKGETGGSK
jgi:hypothetical protein